MSYMSTRPIEETDVVVIGGGPAGSTAATLIAQKGHQVRLFEREHFPRYHIGESLIPETYNVLSRLNMLDKLKGSPFIKKYSVQFVNDRGVLSEPFYFIEHKPEESSQTWQVTREVFDHMMLKNAREHGVEANEGARVLEVLFEGDRAVGVRVVTADGVEREVRSKVVVDASGQSSMIVSRLGLREWDPKLKKAAVWTYWKNAKRDSGRDEGATVVLQVKEKKGWFWYIPLADVISVGVVAAHDYLFKDRDSKELADIYFEEFERCPGVKPRIQNATQVGPFRAAREYSYRSTQAGGDGWVTVGDAFGFLDPLYSSGVLLALKSGQMAADAIIEGLALGDTSGSQLGKWQDEFTRGMDRMRRLVIEFYEGFSFGRFVKRYPHLKGYLTDLLIGDLFREEVDAVWEPMEILRAERMSVATPA